MADKSHDGATDLSCESDSTVDSYAIPNEPPTKSLSEVQLWRLCTPEKELNPDTLSDEKHETTAQASTSCASSLDAECTNHPYPSADGPAQDHTVNNRCLTDDTKVIHTTEGSLPKEEDEVLQKVDKSEYSLSNFGGPGDVGLGEAVANSDPPSGLQEDIQTESACEPSHSTSSLPSATQKTATVDSEAQSTSSTVENGSQRSERKAKAFARVRLVLAHEQLIDDDNFLGFTNRKTYLPPKKKRKLCQFTAEHRQAKPKLAKSGISQRQPKKESKKPKLKNTKTTKPSLKKTVQPKKVEHVQKPTIIISPPEESKQPEETKTFKKVKQKPKVPKLEWFYCDYCHYKTKNKYYIKRHEMTHERPKISFECHYCEYVTKSVIRYKEHEAQHTHEKPFKCQHCDYCSRSYTDFRRHQAKHASEKKYKCPHCDFTTKWSRNVSHHILKHTTARPHKCHICGFSFKRIQDLKYHLYRHNDLKPISCDRCDFKCKTNYELRCHKLKHSDERFFTCMHPGCLQRTKTKSDLTKHMNIHNSEKKFVCGVCQKGFNAKSTLAKHVRIHGERALLKCDICQKFLKTRASLQGHLKLHQGLYPYSCDICHRRFAVKWNLVKHQETHRMGDRPYRCPICPYGARTMEHLLTHIGSMHGKSYAYFCEICRKPFKRYGQLKIHMGRMHAGLVNLDSPLNMESMLKEVGPDSKVGIKQEDLTGLEQSSLELIEVKQEPVDTLSLETSVTALIGESTGLPLPEQSGEGPMQTEQEAVKTDHTVPTVSPSELKTEVTDSNLAEDKPLATVGIYNGFTLPLATKGFEFNLEKRGKKPHSWFMDVNNMPSKAADKHKQYLYKKEHGLLVNHQPKLPQDKAEREAERRRRKLEKYIISCRVSSKSDTTLIFQTEKQKKKGVKASKPRSNTVAALLQKSELEKCCEQVSGSSTIKPRSKSKQKGKKKSKSIKKKNEESSVTTGAEELLETERKRETDSNALSLKGGAPPSDTPVQNYLQLHQGIEESTSAATNGIVADQADKLLENTPVKRKRGRPKGSKNKKPRLTNKTKINVKNRDRRNIETDPAHTDGAPQWTQKRCVRKSLGKRKRKMKEKMPSSDVYTDKLDLPEECKDENVNPDVGNFKEEARDSDISSPKDMSPPKDLYPILEEEIHQDREITETRPVPEDFGPQIKSNGCENQADREETETEPVSTDFTPKRKPKKCVRKSVGKRKLKLKEKMSHGKTDKVDLEEERDQGLLDVNPDIENVKEEMRDTDVFPQNDSCPPNDSSLLLEDNKPSENLKTQPVCFSEEKLSVVPGVPPLPPDTVVKRKRGRPKGSLNKKTLARLTSNNESLNEPNDGNSTGSEQNVRQRRGPRNKTNRCRENTSEVEQVRLISVVDQNDESPGQNASEGKDTDCSQNDEVIPKSAPTRKVVKKKTLGETFGIHANLRQCSVSLSLLHHDPLKVSHSLPSDITTQSCSTQELSTMERKCEPGTVTNETQVAEPVSLPPSRDEESVGVISCAETHCTISKPVSGEGSVTPVSRKRRKPDKSEIRRKFRKAYHSDDNTFPCKVVDPLSLSSQKCVSTELSLKTEEPLRDKDYSLSNAVGPISFNRISSENNPVVEAQSCAENGRDTDSSSTTNVIFGFEHNSVTITSVPCLPPVSIKQEPNYEDISDE